MADEAYEEDQQRDEQQDNSKPADRSDDQLGDAGKRALDAERSARKESDARLKEALERIDKFEDAQRTDEERREHELKTLNEQLSEERARRETVERDLLAQSVAAEVGLPAGLSARLSGADREAMLADAQELKKLMEPDGPRRPAPVPEAGHVGAPQPSNGEIFADAFTKAFNG